MYLLLLLYCRHSRQRCESVITFATIITRHRNFFFASTRILVCCCCCCCCCMLLHGAYLQADRGDDGLRRKNSTKRIRKNPVTSCVLVHTTRAGNVKNIAMFFTLPARVVCTNTHDVTGFFRIRFVLFFLLKPSSPLSACRYAPCSSMQQQQQQQQHTSIRVLAKKKLRCLVIMVANVITLSQRWRE